MSSWLRVIAIFALATALQACGGGSSADVATPTAAAPLLNLVRAAASSSCPAGGATIVSGLDSNGNGVLDTAEITSSQDVCNGTNAPGGTGTVAPVTPAAMLVTATAEPAGNRCSNGGYRISAGSDRSGNGVLEAAEISSDAYVCAAPPNAGAPGFNGSNGANGSNGTNGINGTNGTNGINGTNGTNGISSLIAIVAEPAGTNCTYAGSRVHSGLDANANNVLDAGEVAATNYICNGAPGISWNEVTGTAVQALPNNGYLANNVAQVVVTLPVAPPVGSIVRVSGAGAGGWRLAQNAGQSVLLPNFLPRGTSLTARESNRLWRSVASSADGSKLVAVASGGQIYTSTDSGVSWTPRESNRFWESVASSADGSKLVAAAIQGQIYTSTDSGVTWTARDVNRVWVSVASSADGTKLVATATDSQGRIFTSTDSGATWTQRISALNTWAQVASSADGTRLVATTPALQIWTSTDSGITWTPRASNQSWSSVASSADGNKLVAGTAGGQLWTSTDAGVNWTARENNRNWASVASSADGGKLAAAEFGGLIFTSTDSGVTWTTRDSARQWQAVALSADGDKLLAAVGNGRLYTSSQLIRTTVGVTGFVSGVQYDALELLYTGGGLFTPLSYILSFDPFLYN